MKEYRFGIVGATGLVGSEFIKVLEQRNLQIKSVKMLASYRSAGNKLLFNNQEYTVEETTPESFEDVDIALFSAGGGTSAAHLLGPQRISYSG
ncbi:MAG: hypothetical protein JSU79_11920, partial [Dehalococcoidales bacterium]